MKKIYFFVLALMLSFTTLWAQTAKDVEQFKNAEKALADKNCSEALRCLQQVSIDGKDDQRYVRLMGEMHECKGNKEEAVFFYRKYLVMHPNDTTQFKINYLEADVAKHGSARDKRNENFKSTNRRYNLFNVGLTTVTGSKYESTYKSGWKISFMRGYPVFNKHATVEFGADMAFLTNPNKEWFADALYVPVQDITKLGGAFNPDLNLSLLAILYKTKKLSVAAGPTAGLALFETFNHEYTSHGGLTDNESNFGFFSPVLGVKARFYYKHKFTAFAEYNKVTRSHLDVNTAYDEYNAVPLKMGLISFGIGVYTSFDD